jgi:hypothetical protein
MIRMSLDLGSMKVRDTGNQCSPALQDEVCLLFKMISYVLLGSIEKFCLFIENLLIRCVFHCSLICYRKKMKLYLKR